MFCSPLAPPLFSAASLTPAERERQLPLKSNATEAGFMLSRDTAANTKCQSADAGGGMFRRLEGKKKKNASIYF